MIRNINHIAIRVNRQFLRDRRLLVLSTIVPLLLMLLLKYVFDSLPGLKQLGVNISDYAILLAAYIIHFLAYVYSTIALVRDRVTGTLARMFICGYRRREIVFGYVAGYSTIAIGQSAIVLALTEYLFDVNLRPDFVPVVVTVVALAVVSVGLGVFISNFARNEGQVFPFIPLVTIPSALLSGVVIPIDDLPRVLQWISYAVPLTYAVDILKGIMQEGRSFASELAPFAALAGVGLALLAVASLTLAERE